MPLTDQEKNEALMWLARRFPPGVSLGSVESLFLALDNAAALSDMTAIAATNRTDAAAEEAASLAEREESVARDNNVNTADLRTAIRGLPPR